MSNISTRERLARERIISAQLALAEAETQGSTTADQYAELLAEARSARLALYQLIMGKGRRG